jgi:hypothetical protein
MYSVFILNSNRFSSVTTANGEVPLYGQENESTVSKWYIIEFENRAYNKNQGGAIRSNKGVAEY